MTHTYGVNNLVLPAFVKSSREGRRSRLSRESLIVYRHISDLTIITDFEEANKQQYDLPRG